MTRYRIHPAGVQKTLKATSAEAVQLETDLKPMQGAATSAGTACGNSGAIVPALSDFFAYEGTQLNAIVTRITACLTGAAAATMAYVNGDEEMVQTYQTNAARAQISDIPKRHG
jgi:hypothetical protein